MAGKSGTAQAFSYKGGAGAHGAVGEWKLRDHAWFIAFAPYEAPEIAIACIVENAGGGGGAIAAPTVRQVLAHYFKAEAAASPGVVGPALDGRGD